MPEKAGHVAADNPDCQRGYKYRQRLFRQQMGQPDQSDMEKRYQTASLIRPVTALKGVGDDHGASRGDVQMMPGYKLSERDRQNNPAKQYA